MYLLIFMDQLVDQVNRIDAEIELSVIVSDEITIQGKIYFIASLWQLVQMVIANFELQLQ